MDSGAAPSGRELILKLMSQKELIKIIVNSLTETIKVYTQTAVTPGTPFLKPKATTNSVGVAGVIRLEGGDFALELFLGFSKELFLSLYENMFQMPVDEISAENHDLAGEILNIAFGKMDPQFRSLGYRLNSSFPIIYSNESVTDILNQIEGQGIVIPYTTPDGKQFVVELYSMDSIQVDWKYDPGVKAKTG